MRNNDDDAEVKVGRCLAELLKHQHSSNRRNWKDSLVCLADAIAQPLAKAWANDPVCQTMGDVPVDRWKDRAALPCLLDWVEGSPK